MDAEALAAGASVGMLKVKDMPGTSYEDVVKSAEALGPADRLRLAAELIRRPGGQPDQAAPRSVLELRGLGKDVWLGASVEEYLARERSSWNG